MQGDAVRVPQLDVDARDVRASLDTLRTGRATVVAETVDGTGTISYDSLAGAARPAGPARSASEDGTLAVTAPVDILGQQLTVTGTADVVGRRTAQVRAAVRASSTAEGLPDAAAGPDPAERLRQRASRSTCRLPELPFQLDVRKVRPRPAGLAVTADARGRAAQLGALTASAGAAARPGCWSRPVAVSGRPLVGSCAMGTLLTKRRAVDLCRVATCLCRPVI